MLVARRLARCGRGEQLGGAWVVGSRRRRVASIARLRQLPGIVWLAHTVNFTYQSCHARLSNFWNGPPRGGAMTLKLVGTGRPLMQQRSLLRIFSGMARMRAKGVKLEGAVLEHGLAATPEEPGAGWTSGTKLCDNPDCDDPNCGQTFWMALPFERRSWAWWIVWIVGMRGVVCATSPLTPTSLLRLYLHRTLIIHRHRCHSPGWWTWVPLILVAIGAFWRSVFTIYTPYIEELIGM